MEQFAGSIAIRTPLSGNDIRADRRELCPLTHPIGGHLPDLADKTHRSYELPKTQARAEAVLVDIPVREWAAPLLWESFL